MREIRSYGSVRGTARKGGSYRDSIGRALRPGLCEGQNRWVSRISSNLFNRCCVQIVLIGSGLLAIDVARGQCEDFKLTAPDASQADEFGFNVGMDLGRIIVGACCSDWGGRRARGRLSVPSRR